MAEKAVEKKPGIGSRIGKFFHDFKVELKKIVWTKPGVTRFGDDHSGWRIRFWTGYRIGRFIPPVYARWLRKNHNRRNETNA